MNAVCCSRMGPALHQGDGLFQNMRYACWEYFRRALPSLATVESNFSKQSIKLARACCCHTYVGLAYTSRDNNVKMIWDPPEVLQKLRSYTVAEFLIVRGSRSCSAAADSIHTIMSVNMVLFLCILHGYLRIEKGVWMSHRTSWTDVICVCYGLHGHFIANAADF